MRSALAATTASSVESTMLFFSAGSAVTKKISSRKVRPAENKYAKKKGVVE